MGKSLAAAVLVALVTGCNYGAASFHCENDGQCGAGGFCETSYGGLCSFPVDTAICPSGRRFGELAGGNSNRCVGEQPPPIDAAIDAAPDAPPDAPPDAQACFGGTFLTVCLHSAPAAPLTIGAPGQTINTDDTGMCTPTLSITNNGNYCVIAATDITINAKLRAIGTRPLVLLASGSITTMAGGLIDVGSHRLAGGTTEKGAGADSALCDAGMPPTGGTNGGGAGGAGGSFFGFGGDGGNGGNGGTSGKHGAVVTTVSVLRGGCAGQDGQATSGVNGLAGRGGGAVYLIAGVQINVQGGINAAGEGGAGGAQNVGGAGGAGSGGMIGFDAPVIMNNSLLLASGGGGGGGGGSGGTPPPLEGGTGQDPVTTAAANHGVGFQGNQTFGGDGGNGSISALTNAPGGTANPGDPGGANKGGGGGGGGGTGLIKAPATANLGTNLSPPRSP